jgi:hypothetical protein
MARSIGTTTTTFMKAKVIGIKQDRNAAKHTPKPRNAMPKLQKLLAKGHLVPIYRADEDTIFLIGYQRKPRSRKAHQRPLLLPQPLALGKIDPKPETTCNTESKK